MEHHGEQGARLIVHHCTFIHLYSPAKHARSDLHPIHIGFGHKRAWRFLHIGLLPERILLAKTWQSARTKSDPAWFCTECSELYMEECNRVWKWKNGSGPVVFCQNRAQGFLHISLLPDQMHLAKTWPGRHSRSNPDRFLHNKIMIWSFFERMEPMQEVRSGIYDLAQFWLHTDSNGQNQNASELDPACLLGTDLCECCSVVSLHQVM